VVDTLVISTQHDEKVSNKDFTTQWMDHVIRPIVSLPAIAGSQHQITTSIRPGGGGRFVIGGPMGDAGLPGAKLLWTATGGYSRHGGGAFPARILPRCAGSA